MQKRWHFKEKASEEQLLHLESTLKVTPLMALLLAQRGISTPKEAHAYFKPVLEELHDPFLMKNMSEAVERLDRAITKKEHILIYGDYDVDGTTSVALMLQVLGDLANVSYYIPDRYEEGYGISYLGIDTAKERGAALMIALDCGIKEVEKIAYARKLGLDCIICDHHTPGEIIPDAIVLDQKQPDCNYPYKELSGCGVGFKLLQAYFQKYDLDTEILYNQLDLLAMSIGADIVPVTCENRVLAKLGLERLNAAPRKGIAALLKGVNKQLPLDLTGVVFTIAPRINAAGRLESGSRSVELLIADTEEIATEIANEIEVYNTDRRALDQQITEEALSQVADDVHYATRKSTVVFNPNWHKGVVGIVASRLIEKHYRPTIVLTESKGVATGSARSVDQFNVYEAILSCEHLLTQFGGHHHAAGLTLPLENVVAFREAFDEVVKANLEITSEVPELWIDAVIGLNDFFVAGESPFQIPRLYRMLEQMEPFGPENHKPHFCVKGAFAPKAVLLKEAHLKFDLYDTESGITLPAIAFNMAEYYDIVAGGCEFDCVFTLETNTWKDKTSLQLMVKDIRES